MPPIIYGLNPSTPDAVKSLHAMMCNALSEHEPAYCYVLLDQAFDPDFLNKLSRLLGVPRQRAEDIYQNTDLSGLCPHSPCLLPLPDETTLRFSWLNQINAAAGNRPMQSFVVTPLNPIELKKRLSALLVVNTPDKQKYVLRFADSRILPLLFATLNTEQQAEIFDYPCTWWTFDRTGSPIELFSAAHIAATSTEPAAPLNLSETQFSQLISAAEPDSTIDQLFRIVPDTCRALEPAQLYFKVTDALHHAYRMAIHHAEDKLAYCIAALNINDSLHERDEIKTLISSRQYQPGALAQALGELPDTFWT